MSVVIIVGGGDHNHAVIDNAHACIRRIAVALGRGEVTAEQGAAINEAFAALHTIASEVAPE